VGGASREGRGLSLGIVFGGGDGGQDGVNEDVIEEGEGKSRLWVGGRKKSRQTMLVEEYVVPMIGGKGEGPDCHDEFSCRGRRDYRFGKGKKGVLRRKGGFGVADGAKGVKKYEREGGNSKGAGEEQSDLRWGKKGGGGISKSDN